MVDTLSGNLPQVSWLQLSDLNGEHPPAPTRFGEDAISQILTVLTARRDVWARTLLLITWDENGGFFDHVPPPTAPAGTLGEWLTVANASPSGPIGLGFRVPLLVVSPFARGGFACSETFDHTSTLRFLETRFGVEVPNLSAWRRGAVGDLTGALNLAAPDRSVPSLPPRVTSDARVAVECGTNGTIPNLLGIPGARPYPVPSPQRMPGQEPGASSRPSGVCNPGARPGRSSQLSTASLGRPDAGDVVGLPLTAAGAASTPASVLAAGTGLLAAVALRARRPVTDGSEPATRTRHGDQR